MSEDEMLDLSDKRRRDLRDRRALTVDDEGDEVLLGLTVAESHFYLCFEHHPLEAHAGGEAAIYYQLKHKHLTARCRANIDRLPHWFTNQG
jgi:hypothetical protein